MEVMNLVNSRYLRPSWALFELGKAPVYWKTMNGLPPMSVSLAVLLVFK